jgi:hypothetical protein
MKKRMAQVLQKTAKVGHVNHTKQLKQPKNNPKEVMTFHSGEQNELEGITKNIELKTIQPIGNHPPKLWHIKIELETPQESMWDPTEKKLFGTVKPL